MNCELFRWPQPKGIEISMFSGCGHKDCGSSSDKREKDPPNLGQGEIMSEFASSELTMGQMNAIVKKLGGKDAALKLLRGELKVVIEVKKTLHFLWTTTVRGAERFSAKEKFLNGDPKVMKISYLGDDFRKWFLDKIEENVPETDLDVHRLTEEFQSELILQELGDEAETTLAHIWSLMENQPNGESGMGSLLTDSYANIFYVRDQSGILRVVYLFWRDNGWYVHALAVTNSHSWREGRQVFSRPV